MFYGWGKKVGQFPMPDGRLAVCIYRYVSLLFIFKLVVNKKWYIVDNRTVAQPTGLTGTGQPGGLTGTEQPGAAMPVDQSDENQQILSQSFGGAAVQATDRNELATYFSPEDAPNVSAWDRFGIIIGAAILAAIFGLVGWTQRGTTSTESINRGDCFVDEAAATEIDRLTTPSCDEPHDSQIIGLLELTDAPETMPANADTYWDEVYDRCFTLADERIARVTVIPEDTTIGLFTPTEKGWDDGDRRAACYFYSASGLDGSFITEGPDD